MERELPERIRDLTREQRWALEKELRNIARRTAQNEIGKKPEVTVVISRLSG